MTELVRLDLGCGKSPREGFEGVDLYADNAKHKVDLFKFPFPWEDNSVDEIHCSHFIEHLPCREVENKDLSLSKNPSDETLKRLVGQDFLLAFFDECWRVLKHDSIMTVVVPNGRSDRAFQDPTHRRFIVPTTFAYLNRLWREGNRLDHYNVRCHFVDKGIIPIVFTEMTLLHPEVQQRRMNHEWNTVLDWNATLLAVKQ